MKNLTKYPRRLLIAGILFTYLLLLFFFPSICMEGAKAGLLLWFEQLLPSLLPFLILSGLCIRFDLTHIIGKLFYPFLRFLPISRQGCYPIIMGMLSGYPVGAKTCADMLSENKLSKKEASFLLCCCNNASPMFLTGFAAGSCLGMPEYRYPLFFTVFFSGILSALFLYHVRFRHFSAALPVSFPSALAKTEAPENPLYTGNSRPVSAIQKLDETILGSFEVMVKIGGYVMLFSIPAALLSSMLSCLSEDASLLAAVIPAILEISTGTAAIGSSALPVDIKIILTFAFCAFGGSSALAQTKSVIGSSGLSLRYYLISKLLQAVIAGSSGYLLFLLI